MTSQLDTSWWKSLIEAWRRSERTLRRPTDSLERLVLLYRLCARRLWENNVTAMSAALSFRTIFALIPLLVLAFLVLRSAGAFETGKQSLRRVLDASGFSQIVLVAEEGSATAPADGAPSGPRTVNLADEIERLVERVEDKLTVGRIGPVGFVLLIYTATGLLTAMERSLNRIFAAARSRSPARRLTVYWSVLTLGPIVIVAAGWLGRAATDAIEHATGLSRFLAGFGGWAAPLAGCVLVLWTLYKLLPNTEVPAGAAMVGAITAAPAWLIAKWAFALYVARFVSTGNLYGTIGVVPLFLIWLNLSWLIVLFGAQVAHMVSSRGQFELFAQMEEAALRPLDLLAALLAVAGPYLAGRGPVSAGLVADRLHLPEEQVLALLEHLVRRGLLCVAQSGDGPGYVPARPCDRITVDEVFDLASLSDPALTGRYHGEILAALSRLEQSRIRTGPAITLADLL